MNRLMDDMTWKPIGFPHESGQKTYGNPDVPGALLTAYGGRKWQQFLINIDWGSLDITFDENGQVEEPSGWPWNGVAPNGFGGPTYTP